MAILNFNDFLNEDFEEGAPKTSTAAGVAIVYDNKILLVHPTGASWKRGTCGIPKGGMEEGEDSREAALRELYEETGIRLSAGQLETSPETVEFYSKKKGILRQLIYYVCKIDDLSKIGLTSERVPKSQLQAEEIDWAKFVGPDEAYPIMSRSQLIILDRLLKINN